MFADRVGALLMLGFVAALALSPAPVFADGPQQGSVMVLDDHVLPGESMTVVGTELDDSLGALNLRLEIGGTVADLGATRAVSAGSVSAVVQVPANFPTGYAQVTATTSDGERTWSTYVLVGDRAEGPHSGQTGALADGVGVGVATVVVGLLLFATAGGWYLRGRRRRPPGGAH